MLASTHAVVEEFLINQMGNVFVHQVTGMVLPVLSAPILKFGQDQNWNAYVLMVTGMVWLVLNVHPTKYGIQLH